MPHLYDDRFFDWVNLTAERSARVVLPVVRDGVAVRSVIDVGCGQGTWLAVWRDLGVADVVGLDGAYVDRNRLRIPPNRFSAADLAAPLPVPRRFDLAQSLEVAEHLPPGTSNAFVAGLCALSDVVLFSAAQPGQGGENHVNERPPSFWANLFRERGYAAYDCIRPSLAGKGAVAPWYRFNTMVYANAGGCGRLAPAALARRVDDPHRLDDGGDLGWKLRRMVLRPLPTGAVTWLSQKRYQVACARDAVARRRA